MKLWLLQRRRKERPYVNVTEGVVVRAWNAQDARMFANKAHGEEGAIWEDELKTSCLLINGRGEPGVVLRDYRAG